MLPTKTTELKPAGRIGVGYHLHQRLMSIIRYTIVIILSLLALFPIVVMVLTSLKTRSLVFTIPPVLLFKPHFENYTYVLFGRDFFRFFINSVIVGLGATISSVLVGALAAYGLARFHFLGRRPIGTLVLFLRMVSPVIVVIPVFILYSLFGLSGKRLGLILIYVALNLPFCIWVLRAFIAEVPIEIEESALIDGCGEGAIFFRMILPLIAPGTSVAAIFTFRICWNEFILSLVLTNRYTRTLPVGVSLFITETGIEWGQITAIATIIALPAFVFTFVAAKNLIMGLTAGAVKG